MTMQHYAAIRGYINTYVPTHVGKVHGSGWMTLEALAYSCEEIVTGV